MLIRFLRDTTLKNDSGVVVHYLAGAKVDVSWIQPDKGRLSLSVAARGEQPGSQAYHVWTYPSSSIRRHETPYYPQTDNLKEPDRTCNTSACAMLLECMRPTLLESKRQGREQADDVYYRDVIRYGDTTDHMAQTRALKHYGLFSSFSYNLGFAELDAQLAKGIPTVIGILHRGSDAEPTGGHMITVLRRDESTGGYFCHDSFGSLLDGYKGKVTNGNGVLYSRRNLLDRWLDSDSYQSKSGWGRLVSEW